MMSLVGGWFQWGDLYIYQNKSPPFDDLVGDSTIKLIGAV